jgi:hypothetical protein
LYAVVVQIAVPAVVAVALKVKTRSVPLCSTGVVPVRSISCGVVLVFSAADHPPGLLVIVMSDGSLEMLGISTVALNALSEPLSTDSVNV